VAAVEGDTAVIRPARAARPICHGLPRHPRAAALQNPGGQAWRLGGAGARDARCPWGAGRAGTGPAAGVLAMAPMAGMMLRCGM
jgi:hypothetical protein